MNTVNVSPSATRVQLVLGTVQGLMAPRLPRTSTWRWGATPHMAQEAPVDTQISVLSRFLLHTQDFSLPLAVALGACSFEAYNLPYEMHGLKVVICPIAHATRMISACMHGRQ